MTAAGPLSRSQGLPDRLAVVCVGPDPGHVIPLLKIAAQVRDACDVLVFVPDELVDLVGAYGFDVAGAGPVRPDSRTPDLHRFLAASEWARFISEHAAHKERYFKPLKQNIVQSLPRHREHLADYGPTCVLYDDHGILRKEGKTLLLDLKVPCFSHYPAPNTKRHNTWSLKTAQWKGARETMRDAIRKSDNEVRLWMKGRSANWARVDAAAEIGKLPPVRAGTGGITHLAAGTTFLENALLRDYLLDIDRNRLALPTVPPLETPLSEELRGWLDGYPVGGIAYVSFGTLLQPDAETVTSIVRAALSLGKHVLLQYSGTFPDVSGVRHEQWVAQATVLSHPAVSLFITHGGAGSIEESLWYGKPMVCMPIVWDHFYTSWVASLLGAGVTIPRRQVRSPRRLAAGMRKALMPARADSARFVSDLMHKHWSENQAAVWGLFRQSADMPRTVGLS